MNSIQRPRGLQRSFWTSILLVVGLVLFQSHTAVAQNTVSTPGGTIGKIPKWTAGTALGDSVITESSTGNVGIGTTGPVSLLQVQKQVGALSYSSIAPGTTTGSIHISPGATTNDNSMAITFGGINTNDASFSNQAHAGIYVQSAGTYGTKMYFATTDSYATGSKSRMMIDHLGNVGIGTTSPNSKLEIKTDSSGEANQVRLYNPSDSPVASQAISFYFGSLTSFGGKIVQGWSGGSHLAFVDGSGEVMRLRSGLVGIGTTSPATKLDVAGGGNGSVDLKVNGRIQTGDANGNGGVWLTSTQDAFVGNNGGNVGFWTSPNIGWNAFQIVKATGNVGIGTTAPSARLHVVGTTSLTGNVSVGTSSSNANLDVQGSVTVLGNIAAKYQDVAEWVPATHAMPAGTVVTLDPEHSNQVRASSKAYDTRVAGVVSASPGVILGEGGEGKVMVATTGRVRVKVDATTAPIRVGDLLVTSDKEGIAMRSQPLDLGGTPIHRPGTLIGKALEPLDKGVGEILVLLSLQ